MQKHVFRGVGVFLAVTVSFRAASVSHDTTVVDVEEGETGHTTRSGSPLLIFATGARVRTRGWMLASVCIGCDDTAAEPTLYSTVGHVRSDRSKHPYRL